MCREGDHYCVKLPLSQAPGDPALPHEGFTCQICLDLVYKPIVQSCGHIFCFWCARLSMTGVRQSQCPVCRRPYFHFPRVCEMLHFFLMKAWPEEYSRRADETKEMEELQRILSPRIVDSPRTCKSPRKPNGKPNRSFLRQSERSALESLGEVNSDTHDANATLNSCNFIDRRPEEPYCDESANIGTVLASQRLPSQAEDSSFHTSMCLKDFLCASCGKLLYRPVALNCGKVFCESCVNMADRPFLACPSCRTYHCEGSIHVCLNLHDYLERAFPICYGERQKEVENEQRTTEGLAHRITHSKRACCAAEDKQLNEVGIQIVHVGAGCDGCGVSPIVGHRYRCKDCIERVGYDLCETCYQGRHSLLCGRFNQQHTPDRRMEEIISAFGWTGRAEAPLNLNLENGIITRRRQQQLLIDFDDYIDSLM